MKILLNITALSLLCSLQGFSQVTTNNTNTVAWYVQNVLLGPNVTVSNITYNGSAANANVAQPSVGEFTNPALQIGLASGMIMGSGNVTLASQTNTSGSASLGNAGPQPAGNDPDLASIVSGIQYDKCIVEFDFVPNGDSIKFNYVFASEEYPEYVCSGFNDAFGFFLSGPNPSGGNYTNFNVARVPNSLNPLTFTNTPVAINTINPGVSGTFGSASNCSAIDPNWTTYNVYYTSNTTNAYQYDGRTTLLPVAVPVICGQTYHIKLAVADLGDGGFDSGVFLEEGSFASNGIDASGATAPGDVFLCTTDLTLNFSAGATPPPYSFWDFGDGTGTSTQPNPSYTFADTGYYQVMYVAIDSIGLCALRDTVYFDVNLIYPPQFNATFDIPVVDPCSGLDSLLVDIEFTGTGADSLIWDMGNGDIFYNVDSVDYYYTSTGSYVISLTAIDTVCGNDTTITTNVDYVLNFSQAQATAPDDVILCGSPFNVSFTAGTNPPPDNFWDFGDGSGTSTLPNPVYTYADSGSYQVMYVAIDSSTCNIADTVYFSVDLIIPPQFSAVFNIPPFDPCSGVDSLLVDIAFTGTGADSLIWDMGNGDIFYNVDSVDYYYTNTGTYVIAMTAIDTLCNNDTTIFTTVNYFLDSSVAQANVPEDILLCTTPLNVDFSAGPNPPPHNFWDFGDGSGTSTLPNVTYTYADTGSYQVMYVAIDSSTCNIADTVYFNVQLAQAEQFSATINFQPPPRCGGDTLILDLAFTGSGADSIIWDMGNGDVFYTDSILYYYTVPGTYIVSMTAFDTTCNNVQTISNEIVFVGNIDTEVKVPNIFTPNGDNVNEEFETTSVDATKEYRMTIFNRWGRKVFETEDAMMFWDGKVNGGPEAETGVYFYEVVYTDICSDEQKVQTGTVYIAR